MTVAVKDRLQRMDEYDFEYFVADIWERMGWDCEVSQASADAGIDVVATKSNPYDRKELIQAKRYGPNTTVGGPKIREYASLKQQESNVDSRRNHQFVHETGQRGGREDERETGQR